ncbi:MAG: septum site-determining protein MinD [Clostridia bacterium]|nr:septum site-determining protein MinD [Clostridia bacterium]MBR1683943.1 septum site-determining protein MinD [Clostridia bacterium]
MSSVILITSGKGGVGKSTLSAALGVGLSALGNRVVVLDMDIGLRGQDTLLGLQDRIIYDFQDVIEENCTLDDALLPFDDSDKLYLLPAPQFSRVRDTSPKAFARLVSSLRERFDTILVDCPAGIEKGLRLPLRAGCDRAIIVCTPDDLCIRDAERVVALLEEKKLPRPELIVNRVMPALIERGEMYPPQTVAETLDLPLLGVVPEDSSVYRAQLLHVSLMHLECDARLAVQRIARRMRSEKVPIPEFGRKRSFLARLFRPGVKEVIRLDR